MKENKTMKNIYQENLEEIERQNELIKKYDWERKQLMKRINRIDLMVDRKKRIVTRRETENKFMVKHNLV